MGKLLFFDIDGTLVDFGGKMPESTSLALRKARENGHKCFLCTGRSYNQIYDFLLDFGFDGIVAAAGGYVEYEGREIAHEVFGARCIQEVLDVLKNTDTGMIFQNKADSISTHKSAEVFLDSLRESLGVETLDSNPTFAQVILEDTFDNFPQKYSDAESIIYCRAPYTVEELGNIFSEELEVTPSSFKKPEPYSGEITLRRVNKATGMQRVMEELGYSVEDTIGFGDGANDLDMLRFAGVGVAMGNSQQCAIDAADLVTDHIDKNGLYNAMIKLNLI